MAMIGMNTKKLVLIILLLFFFLTAIGVMGFPQEREAEGRKRQLNWALDGIKARLEPATVRPETLKKYVGNYIRGEVTLKEGQLFIQAGPQQFKMVPLSETYFVLDGEPNIRVEFTFNDQNKEYEIIGHFPDGRQETAKRIKEKT